MANKSNKRWTKRKHRNGIRPVRKGNIKIHLQKLPHLHELALVSHMVIDKLHCMSNVVASIPRLRSMSDLQDPVWLREWHKSKREFDAYEQAAKPIRKVLDLMEKAKDFLRKNKQVSTRDLALDVINEVQPKAPALFYVGEYCNACKKKKTCAIAKLDWSERSDRCKKLTAAWDKFSAEVNNGTYRQPVDYRFNHKKALADAWELIYN